MDFDVGGFEMSQFQLASCLDSLKFCVKDLGLEPICRQEGGGAVK